MAQRISIPSDGPALVDAPDPATTSPEWLLALRAALNSDADPRHVFQPIVDLRRGVVAGYEALARFSTPPHAPPDVWFSIEPSHRLGTRLEAKSVARAIAARGDLPPNCFLSINVSPDALGSVELTHVLKEAGDLAGVVLEVTEHSRVADLGDLRRVLERYRDAGASIALDDAGAGYAGLQHILALRPEFIKVDRSLVADIDHDEAKRVLMETIGSFAARIDAWVIAEGIETHAELASLMQLDVPLGQGYLFGKPGPKWAELDDPDEAWIRDRVTTRDLEQALAPLVEPLPAVSVNDLDRGRQMLDREPRLRAVVVVDHRGRPMRLVKRGVSGADGHAKALRVNLSTEPVEVLQRAMTRRLEDRFDPVVCCDAVGRYVGAIAIERLIHRSMQRDEGVKR